MCTEAMELVEHLCCLGKHLYIGIDVAIRNDPESGFYYHKQPIDSVSLFDGAVRISSSFLVCEPGLDDSYEASYDGRTLWVNRNHESSNAIKGTRPEAKAYAERLSNICQVIQVPLPQFVITDNSLKVYNILLSFLYNTYDMINTRCPFSLCIKIDKESSIFAILNVPLSIDSQQPSKIPGTQVFLDHSTDIVPHQWYMKNDMLCIKVADLSIMMLYTFVSFVYNLVTDLHLCSTDCNVEARTFLESCVKPREEQFVPVTTTYLGALSEVCDSQGDIYINPKYDGISAWLYISKLCPMMFCSSRKTSSGLKFFCKGMCIDTYLDADAEVSQIAIAIEVMQDSIVMYDCCYEQVGDYGQRLSRLHSIKKLLAGIKILRRHVNITDSKRLTSEIGHSITDIMQNFHEDTDGVVIYCSDKRPFKLKPAHKMTVDIMFTFAPQKQAEDGKAKGDWDVDIGVEDIPIEMWPDAEVFKCVYEVRLIDKKILRRRDDRETGNPVGLIKNIIQKYEADKQYSTQVVWAGKDIPFVIAINRMFKRYCYSKFVPAGSKVIDFGSGFLADLNIWTHNKNKVIAVEKDAARHKEAAKRVEKNSKVLCVLSSMTKVDVTEEPYKSYSWCVFMRSINLVPTKGRTKLVTHLMSHKKNILIVCAILDTVVKAMDIDTSKPTNAKAEKTIVSPSGEQITMSLEGRKFTVAHKLPQDDVVKSVQKDRVYTDHLWALKEWKDLAKDHGYSVDVQSQENFVKSKYGVVSEYFHALIAVDVVMCFKKGN